MYLREYQIKTGAFLSIADWKNAFLSIVDWGKKNSAQRKLLKKCVCKYNIKKKLSLSVGNWEI